ncbi:hypothetical protein [Desulfonema ishimotonii]|uniref:hypothetical protein n=1 Tax=Desulfonema ishimotonii TaxID=45657 RepID=UPI000F561426|nr:hypothetical protein [Desulfonema ishimotonii]
MENIEKILSQNMDKPLKDIVEENKEAFEVAKEAFEEALPKFTEDMSLFLRAGLYGAEYKRTGNIIFVLKMMTSFREAGKDIPAKLVNIIGDMAERMMAVFEEDTSIKATGKRFENLVTDTFFGNDKGATNAREYQDYEKYKIYQDVEDTRKKIKTGEIEKGTDAYEIVGKRRGMSEHTIKKYHQEWKKKANLTISEYVEYHKKQ